MNNNNYSPIPVFIIHKGSQDYLRTCVEASRASGNYTILIGSDNTIGCIASEFYYYDQITDNNFGSFQNSYIHMSSNGIEFELLCFERYYKLLAVAKNKSLKQFWMIDSDVLLFKNLSEISARLFEKNNYWAALSTPIQADLHLVSSPHCSLWTIEGLTNFITFMEGIYSKPTINLLQEKYNYHSLNQISGGVCDMTALNIWTKKNSNKIYNLARAHLENFPVFDHNINLSTNYSSHDFCTTKLLKVKLVKLDHGIHLLRSSTSVNLPIACLHFQGSAKKFIPLFTAFENLNLKSGIAYKIFRCRNFKYSIPYHFWHLFFIFSDKIKKLIPCLHKKPDGIIEAEISYDDFYQLLFYCAKDPQIKTVLEIGSSSGGGSTKALVNAIRHRPDNHKARFFCMEISKIRFSALSKAYESDKFVRAYNLTSITHEELPKPNEVINFYYSHRTKLNNTKLSEVLNWLRNDSLHIKEIGQAQNGIDVIKSLENIIFFDMVLIDGSEFTGQKELEKVIGAKIIALDDTESFKCFYAFQKLQLDDSYRLLKHRPDIRNGYAVFIRKDFNFMTVEN